MEMSGESLSASPTTADSGRGWRYDVFLSFRGEDTRTTFTDHLYHGLKDSGIHPYRDDNELRRGQDISYELIQAIRSSRILLVVFSRNYADSRWCLHELVEIMECSRTKGQIVLPVFYHVDPSNVRNQRGSFAEAFAEHEKRFLSEEGKIDLSKWRAALTEAASLSGWHITAADQHEAEVVQDIASRVSVELKHTLLDVPKCILGIESRVSKMIEQVNPSGDGVLFIGISGMGGIGKTTLAKLLFNRFLGTTFKGQSFLADVREKSKQPNGIVHLQEQLLSDVLTLGDNRNTYLGVSDMGINVIKQRLSNNRSVLIVLDDVDDRKQIEALAGDRDWFSSGSRIVFTTRDPDLLKAIKVDQIYTVEELGEDESLQLFNLHAFGNCNAIREEEFIELSKAIINYCKGLPLALELVGSILRNRGIEQWNDELNKLRRSPPVKLQRKLKISFDALADDNDRDVFLDIACFFVGWDKDDAVRALNGCSLSAEIALSVLTKRSLVMIDWENKLMMHDLIRDMGREIVRSESPKNPGMRSRLWNQEDILKTLQCNLGTKSVGGIVQSSQQLDEVKVSAEAFVKMRQLRLLYLDNVHVHGNYGLLPSELRWLRWCKFPLKSIPNDFYMGNMVSINMQHSNLRVAWKTIKVMEKLKILDLSHSHFLIKTPDFSSLPGLEELILEDCTELKDIDETIGGLRRLSVVNLKDCKKLRSIPNSICRVRSLRVLDISGCVSVDELPEDFGGMESLSEFRAEGVSLERFSFGTSRSMNGSKTAWFRGIFWIVKRFGVYFRREIISPSHCSTDAEIGRNNRVNRHQEMVMYEDKDTEAKKQQAEAKPKRAIDDVEAERSDNSSDKNRQHKKVKYI